MVSAGSNKTIWIDICHTPQYNFFKPLIYKLIEKNYKVYITVLARGKTPKIVTHELENTPVEVFIVGKHRMTRLSALIEANLLRIPQIILWRLKHKIDLGLSNGFHAAIACWLTHTPNYTFGDDPQTMDYYPKLLCSSIEHFTIYEKPNNIRLSPKVKVLPVLKEWAYLSPDYYKPNLQVLDIYGVKPKEYIFLREVTVGTVNYTGQNADAILHVKGLIPKNKKVLFSLEEKDKRNLYPSDWIVLQEPIEDIHSLIYYSAGLVSSGDSMAREAALLGVPSYYLGVRHNMPANLAASKLAHLHNIKTMPFEQWLEKLNEPIEQQIENQKKMREKLTHIFIDINQYMFDLIIQNWK